MRSEGVRYCETALAAEETLSPRARARLWFCISELSLGLWAKMRDAAERAERLYVEMGDRSGAMRARLQHGESLTRLRELDRADAELTDALAYFRT